MPLDVSPHISYMMSIFPPGPLMLGQRMHLKASLLEMTFPKITGLKYNSLISKHISFLQQMCHLNIQAITDIFSSTEVMKESSRMLRVKLTCIAT